MKKLLHLLTLSSLLAFLTIAPTLSPIYANEVTTSNMTVITVLATATREIAPDYAVLSVELESKAPTAVAAKNQNDATMSRLLSNLQKEGISKTDFQTSNFSISRDYYYDNNDTRKTSGFIVNNAVSIKIKDLNSISKIIDTVVQSGAFNINSLYFRSDKAQDFDKLLLTEAIQKARQTGDVMANALGMTIHGVISVREEGSYMRSPNYEVRDIMMTGLASNTPIETGTLIIQKQITINYSLI